MSDWLKRLVRLLVRSDDGQGLAEYALLLALIALVAIVAIAFLGSALSDQLTSIGQAVGSAGH